MEHFWAFVDKYIVFGADTHFELNAVDWVQVGIYALWFLGILRLLYLKVKDVKDARYLRNEMVYLMVLFSPIWMTIKLQLIPFLIVNMGIYWLMVWVAKSEEKAIAANEQIGITSNWPKNWDLEAGEFRRMIPEEKEEYFQKLAERQSKMGWHKEVKLLNLTLIYWLPALAASLFAHLYFML